MDKEFEEIRGRLKAVEVVAERAARKGAITKQVRVAPSIITFHAPSASGIFFRYVLFKGTLVGAIYKMKAAHLNGANNAVKLHCEISNSSGSQSQFVDTKRLESAININIPVSQGDILTISGATSDIVFEDISMSFFFIASQFIREES